MFPRCAHQYVILVLCSPGVLTSVDHSGPVFPRCGPQYIILVLCSPGVLTSYGVWMDGELLLNSSSSQTSFVVEGLSPWSLHTLGLQACTAQGCGRGPPVSRDPEGTPSQSMLNRHPGTGTHV